MKIVVFGATSGIAAACIRLWAARGDRLHLFARNLEQLDRLATELRDRWRAEVRLDGFDACDSDSLSRAAGLLEQESEKPDLILLAFGELGRNREVLYDPAAALRITQVNYTATAELLLRLLPLLERGDCRRLAVISSVAGDRGRAGLAVYGAAKAAVTSLTDGLRGWLHPRGVRVTVIKPGPIRTAMTAHLPPSALLSTPERIAPVIVRAVDRSRNQVYVPGYWRLVMALVRWLPEGIMKRIRR